MTTFSIHIDTQGLAEADEGLQRLQQSIANGRDLLRGVGALVKGQTQKRINDDKRAPDGDRWPEWSPEYAKTREPQHSLLVSSGQLFKSITHMANGKVVIVGSNMQYAKWLQEGTRKMPRREFLGLSQDDETDIEVTVMRNIRKLLRGSNA